MTTILAIDSSTGPCSVALWDGACVAAFAHEPRSVMQSARLMLMVEDVLKQAGITYADLTKIAATIGPGSFTGIRVGLAAAQGIAFAARIPAVGFTTLEVLAFAAKAPQVLAVLNAGKGDWYYQHFLNGVAVAEPMLGILDAIIAGAGKDVVMAGNAPEMEHLLSASPLAELAASSAQPHALRPFYIRPPDAKLPTKKQ